MEETTKDLFDIFNDDSAEQFEFLKNKRIALNAKVYYNNSER
jgi:hypothetical protein